MVSPRIARHPKAAGDPPGPFASGGRPLRVVVDIPADQRRTEEWSGNPYGPLDVPDPVAFLWSLTCRPDVELFWIGEMDSPAEAGRVLLDTSPPGPEDNLGFSTVDSTGTTYSHVTWTYEYAHTVAHRDAAALGLPTEEWLRQVLVAQASVELAADVLITTHNESLSSKANYITEANPQSAEEALSLVGLYLRSRGHYPIVPPDRVRIEERTMLAVAVEGLLRSWRVWTMALSEHGRATKNDGPQLLAQSVKERIIRLLRCRDQLLVASLAPQTNTTADRVTESLDYLLVNLVGAFDAAARAAHLTAGLPQDQRRFAGWQNPKWVKKLENEELRSFFADGGAPAVLFWVCRTLRNTVHGESMQPIALHEGLSANPQTLVRLPEDDAKDLAEKFDSLGGRDEWGLRHLKDIGMFIDAAVFVERIIPQALKHLDEIIRMTPTSTLRGVETALDVGPPRNIHEGEGVRARVGLLFGLPFIDPT